jgi:hypothetical protein
MMDNVKAREASSGEGGVRCARGAGGGRGGGVPRRQRRVTSLRPSPGSCRGTPACSGSPSRPSATPRSAGRPRMTTTPPVMGKPGSEPCLSRGLRFLNDTHMAISNPGTTRTRTGRLPRRDQRGKKCCGLRCPARPKRRWCSAVTKNLQPRHDMCSVRIATSSSRRAKSFARPLRGRNSTVRMASSVTGDVQVLEQSYGADLLRDGAVHPIVVGQGNLDAAAAEVLRANGVLDGRRRQRRASQAVGVVDELEATVALDDLAK